MEADQWRFEVGALLRETRTLLARSSWRTVAALVVLTTVGTLIDLWAQQANILFSFVALGFQWWLTTFLLEAFGMPDPGRGSGSIIGVSYLSGIAIILGLVLFVIPGLILLVRWSLAIPIVLSERGGVIGALQESWRRTQGHFWPILGLLLVVYVPMVALLVVIAVVMGSTDSVASSIFVNAGVSLGLIVGWHSTVALFFASDPPTQLLKEVFA
jgi:membrane-anchored glycerophosphoryl diester phosphodiesterase (GDPDase)